MSKAGTKEAKEPKTKPAPAKKPAGSFAPRRWQSDVIVDLIKHFGFPYIALNPGACYRGLHDSLVNYGGNQPPMLLCQHEKIAVQIAHGYAKATGEPMIAIVHNVVGLLHATMGIYYAYMDRAPVFVIGATGPMDEGKRRPFIDWIHTANVQGEQLRDYVKWDYQPGSIEGVPDSFARAYGVMMTEPQGPIYMCYDAWLQEQPLDRRDRRCPTAADATVPVPMAADPAALGRRRRPAARGASSRCCSPNMPAACRTASTIWSRSPRRSAPRSTTSTAGSISPTAIRSTSAWTSSVFREADLILSLDTRDWEKPTHHIDRTKRTRRAALSGRTAR